MSLNKTRKRLIENLKRQADKRFIMARNWELFKERFLETRRANLERLVNAGSPFRGGEALNVSYINASNIKPYYPIIGVKDGKIVRLRKID